MKINLALSDAESYGKETLAKIRSHLGAENVVLGSYVPLGTGQIRVDLRLQDAVAGETLAAVSEKGAEEQIDELVSRVGSVLREKLGAAGMTVAEAAAVKATLPSNPAAVRFYIEGLAKLRAFDAAAGRDLLQKAIAADPDYSLAHSALSAAWDRLGYDERAKSSAKRAFELSTKLSREERLSVEGRYRSTTNEHENAVDIYRTLSNFFPDNLDYALQLVDARISARKGRDALATIEALRKLPPPAGTDPRVDLAEAAAAASLSDFRRQQAASANAAAKAAETGMRLLAARAHILEGNASRRLGQLDKAMLLYEKARDIFTEAGDRRGRANAMSTTAIILGQRGELAKSESLFKEALEIQRQIGFKNGVGVTLNNIAAIRSRLGDESGAMKLFEESLAIARELDDRRNIALALTNLGIGHQNRGDVTLATKMFEEALALRRETGEKAGVAQTLNWLAVTRADQGDLPAARKTYEEVLSIRQEIGEKSTVASTLRSLGTVVGEQGDLAGARERIEKALALQTEIGEKREAARTRLTLAEVLIEETQAVRAEALVREALAEIQTEKAAANQASAHRMLAMSLLAQGKLSEARTSIDTATRLFGKSDDVELRLRLLTTAARVRSASGRAAEAAATLETVARDAGKSRLVGVEFEARLALAEAELKSGRTDSGRARLTALEREAASKGFLLIARKAQASLGQIR